MSYRAFWQRRCRAAAAGAVLKPQGGNCAVLPQDKMVHIGGSSDIALVQRFSGIHLKGYLKTKKMTDIPQTQAGFKAKSRRNPLWIPRLFNVKSGCVCRNRRYFRLFRYTLTQNRAVHTEPPLFCVEDARHFRQHRTIPALRLKHRSGGCGTASALPKCSIIHKVLSALLA